jgi:hypothetical protein
LFTTSSKDCNGSSASLQLSWKDVNPDSSNEGCVGLIRQDTGDSQEFSFKLDQSEWSDEDCPMFLQDSETCENKVFFGPDRIYNLSITDRITDRAGNPIIPSNIEFLSQESFKVDNASYSTIEENGELRARNTLHTSGSLQLFFNKRSIQSKYRFRKF